MRMDTIRNFDKQRQVFTREALRTPPFIRSVLVQPGKGHSGWSFIAILKHGGLDASEADFVNRSLRHRFVPFMQNR